MFCRSCGANIGDSKFCPYCGAGNAENSNNTAQSSVQAEPARAEVVGGDRGPWKVFAVIGFISGIFSLVLCWCYFVGFGIAVDGLIFSILGKKSKDPVKQAKAQKGLVMNIIGMVLGLLIGIVIVAALASAAGDAMDDMYSSCTGSYCYY